jgi:FtsZ-interacting cell division protein ZipA
MATSTIIVIVIVAVVAILIAAALAWVIRNKRTEHRRVHARDIRDKAAEQSHKVSQREAFADETAAKGRAAQAEAEAMATGAAGLQHQAHAYRTDAATARGEVNQAFARADKVDPDSQASNTAREHSETRETPRGTSTGKQAAPATPRAG